MCAYKIIRKEMGKKKFNSTHNLINLGYNVCNLFFQVVGGGGVGKGLVYEKMIRPTK